MLSVVFVLIQYDETNNTLFKFIALLLVVLRAQISLRSTKNLESNFYR